VLKLSSAGSDVFPKVLNLSSEVSECKPLDMGLKMFGGVDDVIGAAFDRAAARMEGVERVPIEALARVSCQLDAAAEAYTRPLLRST